MAVLPLQVLIYILSTVNKPVLYSGWSLLHLTYDLLNIGRSKCDTVMLIRLCFIF